MHKYAVCLLVLLPLVLSGCSLLETSTQSNQTLTEARRGFRTKLLVLRKSHEPVLAPPPQIFQLVRYPAPLGQFPAYISRPRSTTKKYPAILWLAGGFDYSIDDTPWTPAPADNDQSARAFWQSGIITMYPSLRGGNGNPGYFEGLYGEVDDVLAAAKFLARQPNVDPHRVYLGGHSTGGTLALLTAESTDQFRAVFAFGPVTGVGVYGADNLPFDTQNRQELLLRAPILWLKDIRDPTYAFEGTEGSANIDSLYKLQQACTNPRVHFYPVPGATHFSTLAPITKVIAKQILQDQGTGSHISFSDAELAIGG